jgi:hypothetical protein
VDAKVAFVGLAHANQRGSTAYLLMQRTSPSLGRTITTDAL